MGVGLSLKRAFRTPLLASSALISCVLVALAGSGCDSDSGQKKVSSGFFAAPITDPGSISVLANKLSFLRAIEPNRLDSELESLPAEARVLGRLWRHDEAAGSVTRSDNLLVYETQSRSALSVNLCPEGTPFGECGRVKLNYDLGGLNEEQSSQGSITQGSNLSTTVTPLQLKNGWLLAYDSGSKNVVAFREEAPRELLDGSTQAYRDFPPDQGSRVNSNFGLGNSLVLSVVISGEELSRQIGSPAIPIVTRFFEIEENKILLFFSTLREIHILELEEEVTPKSFDLNDPDNPDKRLDVPLLRGAIKLFPSLPGTPGSPEVPYLTFRQISENITGNESVWLDTFQPIMVPDEGSALVFERITSYFLKVFSRKDDPQNPDEITGGGVARAIFPQRLFSALQAGVGGNVVSPPLTFQGAFYHNSRPEILLMEEKTNNLLAYEYTKSINDNVKIFVPSANFLQPRSKDGSPGTFNTSEPVMIYAVPRDARGDSGDSRLAFDQGEDQLLSINYQTGAAAISATRSDIIAATSLTSPTPLSLANITYTLPLNDREIRAFDTQSTSLLRIRIRYLNMPSRFD